MSDAPEAAMKAALACCGYMSLASLEQDGARESIAEVAAVARAMHAYAVYYAAEAVRAERKRAIDCADPHLWAYRTVNAYTCLMAAQGEIESGRDPSARLAENVERDRAEDERIKATRAKRRAERKEG